VPFWEHDSITDPDTSNSPPQSFQHSVKKIAYVMLKWCTCNDIAYILSWPPKLPNAVQSAISATAEPLV